MIEVLLLTEAQKNEIEGKKYAPFCLFNPIQDIDDNWVISSEEFDQTVYSRYSWLSSCPKIEFKPKPYTPSWLST